jgi:hypothetical protein
MKEDLAVLTLNTRAVPTWQVWPREQPALRYRAEVAQDPKTSKLECSRCRGRCRHVQAVAKHKQEMQQ